MGRVQSPFKRNHCIIQGVCVCVCAFIKNEYTHNTHYTYLSLCEHMPLTHTHTHYMYISTCAQIHQQTHTQACIYVLFIYIYTCISINTVYKYTNLSTLSICVSVSLSTYPIHLPYPIPSHLCICICMPFAVPARLSLHHWNPHRSRTALRAHPAKAGRWRLRWAGSGFAQEGIDLQNPHDS